MSNLSTPVEVVTTRSGVAVDRLRVGPDEQCRVLLIYPNYRGMNMLPPAIGLLSAVLLEGGHQVQVFDTTYYESVDGTTEVSDSDGKKSDQLMARHSKCRKR